MTQKDAWNTQQLHSGAIQAQEGGTSYWNDMTSFTAGFNVHDSILYFDII